MTDSATISLPLKARGERPYFHDEPAVDKLTAMVLALAGELSVQNERHDTLLRVLADKGVLQAAELEAYQPTSEVMEERESRRQALLESVMHIVLQDVEAMQRMQDGQ